jgi:hypothetical protein
MECSKESQFIKKMAHRINPQARPEHIDAVMPFADRYMTIVQASGELSSIDPLRGRIEVAMRACDSWQADKTIPKLEAALVAVNAAYEEYMARQRSPAN